MSGDERNTEALLAAGDSTSRELLFARYGARLRRMVRMRLDRRVRGRVDEDDVVQEVLLEVVQRMDEYRRDPRMPFFLWVRFLAYQRLAALHRHHLGVKARDARREMRLDLRGPDDTSAPVDRIAGRATSPARAAERSEARAVLTAAMAQLAPADREILSLRHFEQLTNSEAAAELGIDVSAASKRYMRSLQRLGTALGAGP